MGISWGFGSTIGGALCEKASRQLIMQIGFPLLWVSCWLSGPSTILHLPDNFWIMLVGIVLNWFFGAWLVVPVASEVIEETQKHMSNKWSEDLKQANCHTSAEINKIVAKRVEATNDELTDKASALMNMAYAFGCAIAPILGGYLND